MFRQHTASFPFLLQLFCKRQDAFAACHREAYFLPRCSFNLHDPSNKCHVLHSRGEAAVTNDQFQEPNHRSRSQVINKRPGF